MKRKATKSRPYPELNGDAKEERKSSEIVRKVVSAAQDDGETVSHVLQEVIEEFGGSKAFSKKIKALWDNAPDGSVAQQRVIAIVLGLLQGHQKEREERRRSSADLTTEELQATMHAFLQQHGYATPDEVKRLRSENGRLHNENAALKRQLEHAKSADQQP